MFGKVSNRDYLLEPLDGLAVPFWVKKQDNLCPCQWIETLKMLYVVKGSNTFILLNKEKQK